MAIGSCRGVTCPLRFLILKRNIPEHFRYSKIFFQNRYGKVAIDNVTNFRRPKIFRREFFSKIKLKIPNFFGRRVKLHYHQYHLFTMGAYVEGIGA